MAVTGKSGKIYADAVKDKSVSELFRMGYTSAEVDDIQDVILHKTETAWDLHPSDRRRPSKNTKRSSTYRSTLRLSHVVIALFVLYLGISIFNGVQENEATKTINAFSRVAIGYDALVDKGVLGHAWTAFTNPSLNFSSLSRSMETRTSYAMFEGFGVWKLTDYMDASATGASSSPEPQGVSETVEVIVDNYIYHSYSKESGIEPVTHNQYHKEVFTSLVNISFSTDFLVARGLRYGDTYKLSVNMNYLNNADEVHTSKDVIMHIIIGESTGTTITVEEPDCYITVDDIIGFNFE